MGSSDSSVYLANSSGQDIYCMAVLSKDWAIADFITDIAELAIPALDLAKEVTGLPTDIKTITDLFTFLKSAAKVVQSGAGVGSSALSASKTLLSSYKKQSVHIAYKNFTQVESQDFLQTYLSISGIADLLGAKTVSMLVMNGDGSQLALWDTGNDDSWIATNNTAIIRSIHGAIWQSDASSGNISWPSTLKKPNPHHIPPYMGSSHRPDPNNLVAFVFLWMFIWFSVSRKLF